MSMNPRLLRPLATMKYGALRAGLVAYWPLNETAASGDVTAVDWTRRGNDLTSNNSVLSVAGKVGNARAFVRTNSEYLSGTHADLDLGEIAWTIAFWFLVPTGATNSRFQIFAKDVSGARQVLCSYNLDASALPATDSIFFQHYLASGTAQTTAIAGVSRNVWNFVSMSHAANSAAIECNLNRSSSVTLTRPSGTWASFNSQFNIGRREFSGFNDYSDVQVDEFAVWHRSLSSADLDAIYNSGSGIDLRR